jgi:hypothetical protein
VGIPLSGLRVSGREGFDPDRPVTRETVEALLAEMTLPGADPEAHALLLRARRLAAEGDRLGAIAAWEQVVEEAPGTVLAAEARADLARAHLDAVFSAPDENAAEAALVASEEWGGPFDDFLVALVRAVRDLAGEEGEERAGERLGAAVKALRESRAPRKPEPGLEADVAAVRRAAFRPNEPLYYRGEWKPESWQPYVVLTPEIRVTLADGTETEVDLVQTLPEVAGALYIRRAELARLQDVLEKLGGGARTDPASIMAIPQPKGGAKAIAALIGRFFQITPGHWGGWHLETYPILHEIVFEDEERDSATVHFRVRYEGGEAKVKRSGDGYELGEIKLTWIE